MKINGWEDVVKAGKGEKLTLKKKIIKGLKRDWKDQKDTFGEFSGTFKQAAAGTRGSLEDIGYLVEDADISMKKYRLASEIIYMSSLVLLILALLSFVNNFVMIYQVDGISMNPTLSSGQLVAVSKTAGISKGDIVVYDASDVDGLEEMIIKRVIAEAGDNVKCESGQVYVNGEPLLEDYAQGVTEDFEQLTVPENCVFIMGDNREHSLDSRAFGPFDNRGIIGKVCKK